MSDSNGSTSIPDDTEKTTSIPFEILIGERLEQLAPLSASCCIYRVPEEIRCLTPHVYTPTVVSIGPLHHVKESLEDMEEHKYRYLKEFLDRTHETLEYYIQKIRSHEEQLRGHYAETIKYSSDDFVKIILVDSAFIVELLLKLHYRDAARADRIITSPKIDYIGFDLLLLENQLPFFILEALFDPDKMKTSNNGASEKPSFTQLSCKFLGSGLQEIGVDYNLETAKGAHFLDIIRKLCLPAENRVGGTRKPEAIFAPSITELHQAGVKLRVGSTRNLFDIRFENGILEIPELTISDYTERILRNLAEYEKWHYRSKRIADYLDVLDSFVNTPHDVDLLVKYRIVTNLLGDSSEACSMINRLGKGILLSFDDFYFADLYEALHKHYKRPWNKWKANLRQNYLNTPWTVVSVVAAAFLIVLTIIQTVCSLVSL